MTAFVLYELVLPLQMRRPERIGSSRSELATLFTQQRFD